MIHIEPVHDGLRRIVPFEIHLVLDTALYIGRVIHLALHFDSHTAFPGICAGFLGVVNIPHFSVAGPVQIARFLFQIGYADAKVGELVGIFAGQLVKGGPLLRIQLVFLCHKAGNDLGQFIAGDISFPFEGAVRVSFHHSLVRQVGYRLVSPVIGAYIGKGIGCQGGNAGSQGCRCSQDHDFLHNVLSFDIIGFLSGLGTVCFLPAGNCSHRVSCPAGH